MGMAMKSIQLDYKMNKFISDVVFLEIYLYEQQNSELFVVSLRWWAHRWNLNIFLIIISVKGMKKSSHILEEYKICALRCPSPSMGWIGNTSERKMIYLTIIFLANSQMPQIWTQSSRTNSDPACCKSTSSFSPTTRACPGRSARIQWKNQGRLKVTALRCAWSCDWLRVNSR